MPYSKENEERQRHEEEFELEGVFLEVVVSPHLDQQADPAPPEKKVYQATFERKKTSLQIYLSNGMIM